MESSPEFLPCVRCKKPTNYKPGCRQEVDGKPVYCVPCFKEERNMKIPSIPESRQIDPTRKGYKKSSPEPQSERRKLSDQELSVVIAKRHPKEEFLGWLQDSGIADKDLFMFVAARHSFDELQNWLNGCNLMGCCADGK